MEAIHYINESAASPDRGKFVLIGEPISSDLAGVGVPKTRPALRDLVADVITGMIADGAYARIFDKWEMPYTKVKAVWINGEPRTP